MTTAIETIRIGEDEIQGIVTEDGERWIALRRACEALGVDAEGQRQKIGKLDWACTLTVKAHDASGREQELFCLHKDSVPMWLATMVPSLLAEAVREKVSRWQRLAAKALADWAYGRRPVPSTALDLRDPAALQRLALQLTGIVQEQQKALAVAETKIAADAPKVAGWHALMDSEGLIPIMDAGKAMGVQPLLFHRWLVSAGHVYKRGGNVLAREEHIQFGRMKHVTVTVGENADGIKKVRTYAKITGHGLAYFTDRIEQFRTAATREHRRLPVALEALALPDRMNGGRQ